MPVLPPVPVSLVTGVDPDAMSRAVLSLLWEQPRSVAVQHAVDARSGRLTRTVSDATGRVEQVVTELDHACVACAVREDVVPTLARLAGDGRWDSVLCQLPVGAEAAQVCHVVEHDLSLRRTLRLASVVAAVDGPGVEDDLLGDDLLRERDLASAVDDARGVGEVGCALVEAADVVVVTAGPDGTVPAVAVDLVGALSRPGARVVRGAELLDAAVLVGHLHHHGRTLRWTGLHPDAPSPAPRTGRAWTLDLRSDRAFHPDRLMAGIDRLGGGRHRSRGWFSLPTRPGRHLVWDGAGGQLSVGDQGGSPYAAAGTRLLVTGVGEPPADLEVAFDELLLTAREHRARGATTSLDPVDGDGFEPWLGPVRRAA